MDLAWCNVDCARKLLGAEGKKFAYELEEVIVGGKVAEEVQEKVQFV